MSKRLVVFAVALGAVVACAQAQSKAKSTNAPPAKIVAEGTNAPPASLAESSLEALTLSPYKPALPWFRPVKANEWEVGKLTYSGIVVQAIKAKNPLQLINPLAPARYGSGQDNVVNDSFSVTGPVLKLFSIDF